MKKYTPQSTNQIISNIGISFRSEAEAKRAEKTVSELHGPIYQDEFVEGEISANNIRRSHAVYGIPIEKLHSPDYVIEPDKKFIELFQMFLLGQISAYSTRVCSDEIMDGFCDVEQSCIEKYEDTPETEIERNCMALRAGERISIWVRENESCPSARRFFHTDAVAVLKAYRKLGILDIPVIILATSPPLHLEHSAYVIGHGGPLKDPVARVEQFVAADVASIPALTHIETPLSEVLTLAKSRLKEVISSLTEFHHDSPSSDIVHYHDSLYSLLIRAQEHLLAVDLLVENHLWSAIPNLQRSLYELCLTCYVDWVAPQQVYHDLSIASSLDSSGLKLLEEYLFKDYCKETSTQKAKLLAKRALKLVRWLEKVSNKAAFAPVGIALHDKFYSALSSHSHQDFNQTAKHANRFRDKSFEYFDKLSQNSLADFLNIVVGNIVIMVERDIGHSLTKS